MAGPEFSLGDYEFQCLHGMGEPLYDEVVGQDKLNRPCRVYAPVGTHETLLAYLVRRLLENGANSSRSEEHTSELQSLMRISYAVFCLKKKKHQTNRKSTNQFSTT